MCLVVLALARCLFASDCVALDAVSHASARPLGTPFWRSLSGEMVPFDPS
jgi:hypothetical protein